MALYQVNNFYNLQKENNKMKLIMENWNTFINEEEVLNEKIDRDAIIKAASKLLDKVPSLSKVIEKAVSQSPEMQDQNTIMILQRRLVQSLLRLLQQAC